MEACSANHNFKTFPTCEPLSRTVAMVLNWHSALSTSLKSESFNIAASTYNIYQWDKHCLAVSLKFNLKQPEMLKWPCFKLPEHVYFAAWLVVGYILNDRIEVSLGFIMKYCSCSHTNSQWWHPSWWDILNEFFFLIKNIPPWE